MMELKDKGWKIFLLSLFRTRSQTLVGKIQRSMRQEDSSEKEVVFQ
jgi:hypothetical protein